MCVAFIKHLSEFSGRSRDKCLSACSPLVQEYSCENWKPEAHSALSMICVLWAGLGDARQSIAVGCQKYKGGRFLIWVASLLACDNILSEHRTITYWKKLERSPTGGNFLIWFLSFLFVEVFFSLCVGPSSRTSLKHCSFELQRAT